MALRMHKRAVRCYIHEASAAGGNYHGTVRHAHSNRDQKDQRRLSLDNFSETLQVMDFGPGGGEKLFDPWASVRKGQDCPQEIRTKKFMVIFFFPDLNPLTSHALKDN